MTTSTKSLMTPAGARRNLLTAAVQWPVAATGALAAVEDRLAIDRDTLDDVLRFCAIAKTVRAAALAHGVIDADDQPLEDAGAELLAAVDELRKCIETAIREQEPAPDARELFDEELAVLADEERGR